MKPTQEQVIAWAREVSGVEFPISTTGVKIGMSIDHLERFANLVAAAERERILDMCKEGLWDGEGIRSHLEKRGQG